MGTYHAPAETAIGHVHLKVSDVDRSCAFYNERLGLGTIARYPSAAFLSAGGYHHHVGMNHWYSRGGTRCPKLSGGLLRMAVGYLSDADLEAGKALAGTSGDFAQIVDPDGLLIELVRVDAPATETGTAEADSVIAPTASIRSVDLAAADPDRLSRFYADVLGFAAAERDDGTVLGTAARPHLVGIIAGNQAGGRETPAQPGLYHTAILYPTRSDLARAVAQMLEANAGFRMAEDHGVSNAVYFVDPENNGIELYWDRPRNQWPRNDDGKVSMDGGLLDLTQLLSEA